MAGVVVAILASVAAGGVALLGCWAILHIRKSVTTWSRFDEIERRLSALEGKKLCKCGV